MWLKTQYKFNVMRTNISVNRVITSRGIPNTVPPSSFKAFYFNAATHFLDEDSFPTSLCRNPLLSRGHSSFICPLLGKEIIIKKITARYTRLNKSTLQ